jgi:hypothetical protein
MAITAPAGVGSKISSRETREHPQRQERIMKRDTEMQALTPAEIGLVAGGTSISPESLAKARATIKGRDGTTPEKAAEFLFKVLNGLVRL